MALGDGLADRIGKAINQLDIDFSRFTLAGWAVSLLSLALGLVLALLALWVTPNDMSGKAKPLAFGFTMLGVTVVVFVTVRWILSLANISLVTKSDEDGSWTPPA